MDSEQTRFLKVLYRLPDKDAFGIISDASLHFAQVAYHARSSEDYEVVYFYTLFITRFIPFIYYEPTRQKCAQKTQQFYHMILSTFLRWLDSVLFVVVQRIWLFKWECTPTLLQNKLAINGLLMQCVSIHIHSLYSDIYPIIATQYLRLHFRHQHVC